MLAPAKLTVSLRVTGVRPDGYHELDAEMVTLDLADELVLREGGSALAVSAGDRCADGRAAGRRPEPGGAGAGGLWPHARRCSS